MINLLLHRRIPKHEVRTPKNRAPVKHFTLTLPADVGNLRGMKPLAVKQSAKSILVQDVVANPGQREQAHDQQAAKQQRIVVAHLQRRSDLRVAHSLGALCFKEAHARFPNQFAGRSDSIDSFLEGLGVLSLCFGVGHRILEQCLLSWAKRCQHLIRFGNQNFDKRRQADEVNSHAFDVQRLKRSLILRIGQDHREVGPINKAALKAISNFCVHGATAGLRGRLDALLQLRKHAKTKGGNVPGRRGRGGRRFRHSYAV